MKQASVKIWQLIDGKNTVQQIINRVKKEFPERVDQAELGVMACIDHFEQQQLVQLVEY